jgi:hypothetical protein
MKTVCLQVGNSDDKLSQADWSRFVSEIRYTVVEWITDIHFSGASYPTESWQNACFVWAVPDENIEKVKDAVKEIRQRYQQDSVAWLEGSTEFV